jgi:hypothetical protein
MLLPRHLIAGPYSENCKYDLVIAEPSVRSHFQPSASVCALTEPIYAQAAIDALAEFLNTSTVTDFV